MLRPDRVQRTLWKPVLCLTRGLVHRPRYLFRVVHQRAVVTVVSHTVTIGVPLVSVVDVRTVVSLVKDI